MRIKVLIIFLFVGSIVCSAFTRIPQAFYDSTGGKVCQGEKRLVIWQYDYCGYMVTYNNSIFTEYFMYCDTTEHIVHTAAIHKYTYNKNRIKDIKRTRWTHYLSTSEYQEFSDSLITFFHFDQSTYSRIDTLYEGYCCMNFLPKTIWLYDENDSLCMHLNDDEFGIVNNQCLSFILQTIYLNYEYYAYWLIEQNPEVKWRKQRRKSRFKISHRLKTWFKREDSVLNNYSY